MLTTAFFTSVPMSVVFGVVLSNVWLHALTIPNEAFVPGYSFAVYMITGSAIVEMFAESLFNYGQVKGYVKLRVLSEGSSLVIRCLIQAAFVRSHARNTLYVYAYAQMVASVFYVMFMWIYMATGGFSQQDEKDKSVRLIDFLPNLRLTQLNRELVALSSSFMKQTVVKQLLTEGEKFVMTFFNPLSFAEQGVFELVNNLGELFWDEIEFV